MPRDQVHREKRELWNDFSIVSNKTMIRKKEEREMKMWMMLLLPK